MCNLPACGLIADIPSTTPTRAIRARRVQGIPKDLRAMLIEQRGAIKDAQDDILRRLAQN